jgi:hypothetical protein
LPGSWLTGRRSPELVHQALIEHGRKSALARDEYPVRDGVLLEQNDERAVPGSPTASPITAIQPGSSIRFVEMPKTRVLAICCGYEDGNDLDRMRDDPLLKLVVGRCPESGGDLIIHRRARGVGRTWWQSR